MNLSVQDRTTKLIQESLEKDDPDIIIHEIDNLELLGEAVEDATAQLYCSLDDNWTTYSLSKSEAFTSYVLRSGKHIETVKNHMNYYRYRDKLPENLRELPRRKLNPVIKTLAQGYDISDEYDEIAKAENPTKIREIMRRVKGEEPRKSGTTYEIHPDGSIIEWQSGLREEVGWVNISKDKMINRLINAGFIIR